MWQRPWKSVYARCSLLLHCPLMFCWKHHPHGKLGFRKTWQEMTHCNQISRWSACAEWTPYQSCCGWSVAVKLSSSLLSLFRMLTQLPERRRLSCGPMWPDRTHSSSLTFLCACSLGRELFMLHCFHRKQCHFNSQPLGYWDLFCITVLWDREYSPL